MAAASGGYAEIVKLLLAKGADVSARDQQGRTAFSMAEAAGESQVADLLKSGQNSSVPEQPASRITEQKLCPAKLRRAFRFTVPQTPNQAAQRLTLARAVTNPLPVNLADS